MDRRDFMRLLAAASSLGVAGCCYTTKPIRPEDLLPTPMPVFTDPPLEGNKGPLKLALDAHVHLFNGSDMQTSGYFKGPVLQDLIKNDAFRDFVEALSLVIHLLMMAAPGAGREVRKLNRYLQLKTSSKRAEADAFLQGVEQEQQAEIKSILQKHVSQDIFDKYLAVYRGALEKARETGTLKRGDEVLLQELSLDRSEHLAAIVDSYYDTAFLSADKRAIVHKLSELDKIATRELKVSAIGFWHFVTALMGFRFHNLKKYREGFSTKSGAFGINACCASMMDFDYWLGDCDDPATKIADQIELMDRMAVMYDGFMLPVISYNPWPHVENHAEVIALINKAVTEHGFVGVKIYPAIGYKPARNTVTQYHPKDKSPADIPQLNENLKGFFKLCRDLDIPVMAHSNNSKGEYQRPKPGEGEDYSSFGGPASWTGFFQDGAAAEVADKRRKQRLALGHFGGVSQWGSVTDNWSYAFFDMVKQLRLEHVYGDISYWNDLYGGAETEERMKKVLKKIVSEELTFGPPSGLRKVPGFERLIFGSDWFMMIKEQDWTGYPGNILGKLTAAGFTPHMLKRIFYRNLLDLYGLTPPSVRGGSGGANFERLSAYYKVKGITPSWFEVVNSPDFHNL